MARISKGALRPNSEAPRKTRAGVERGTTNYVSNSEFGNSISYVASQCHDAATIVGAARIGGAA